MNFQFMSTGGSNSTGFDNIQTKSEELATTPYGLLRTFYTKKNKNQHQLKLQGGNVRFGLQNRLELD